MSSFSKKTIDPQRTNIYNTPQSQYEYLQKEKN